MKGYIVSIKRFAQHDGAGVRSTVFLKGCGLRCVWCHNPETFSRVSQLQFFENKCISCGECARICENGALAVNSDGISYDTGKCKKCFVCAEACPVTARIVCGMEITADELVSKLLQDKPFYDMGGGVTISGGEPLLQADFTAEVAEKLHRLGISVDIDTCGYADASAFEKVLPYVDEFLFDIKAIDEDVHRKCTGSGNKEILSNLKYLLDNNANIEMRYPYVPNYNDGEVEKIGAFLSGKAIRKIKVLAYHDSARSKYKSLGLTDTMPSVKLPSVEDIDKAVGILKSYKLNAVNGLRED